MKLGRDWNEAKNLVEEFSPFRYFRYGYTGCTRNENTGWLIELNRDV